MVFIYLVFYGLFGAVTGSFLNVCILRIPENQNFVTGRSHCSACGHVLAFYDMVPVLSWLFLKGRCRYCRAPVSIQYPAVELLTASAFILCLLSKRARYGFSHYVHVFRYSHYSRVYRRTAYVYT